MSRFVTNACMRAVRPSSPVWALAFGLGNRDLAGQVTREWYEQYRAERDDAERRERELEAKEDLEMSTEYPETAPTHAEGGE